MSEFNLLWRDVERDSAKVHFLDAIRARNNAEQTCQRTRSRRRCKHDQIITYRVEQTTYI